MKFLIRFFLAGHVFIYRLTKGSLGATMGGMTVLLLDSVGRKSGQKRTTPLAYIRDGDNYVITASNGGAPSHPGWYYNLTSNPHTTIQVRADILSVEAEQAGPEDRSRLWAQLTQVAAAFEKYQAGTSREIPMMILRPTK